jgi:hypothetical protein
MKWVIGVDEVKTLQDMASRTNHPKAGKAMNDTVGYLEELRQWANGNTSIHQESL